MQVIITITKWRVVLATILLILGNKVYKYSTQPFMFELFKNTAEAQKYFDEHYPPGGRSWDLVSDIIKSGGKCIGSVYSKKIHEQEGDFEYNRFVTCEYYSDLIALNPLGRFNITIYVDEDGNIIKGYYTVHFDRWIP